MPILLARLILFLVTLSGFGIVGFGGWIGWRGVVLYEADPVLMGTGGGLAIGGLLVVALAIGAGFQVSAARDLAAMRALAETS